MWLQDMVGLEAPSVQRGDTGVHCQEEGATVNTTLQAQGRFGFWLSTRFEPRCTPEYMYPLTLQGLLKEYMSVVRLWDCRNVAEDAARFREALASVALVAAGCSIVLQVLQLSATLSEGGADAAGLLG